MIVGSYFDGDDDGALAWKQHGVYGRALGMLVQTCNRYAIFAKKLLEDTGHGDWGAIIEFDHRTLQLSHDLLAAAWRFRICPRQGTLRFVDGEVHTPDEALWLDWLRHEFQGWIDHPHLVRLVHVILTNQNQLDGDVAESQVCLRIMNLYPEVPWARDLRDALEEDFANLMEKRRRAATPVETQE